MRRCRLGTATPPPTDDDDPTPAGTAAFLYPAAPTTAERSAWLVDEDQEDQDAAKKTKEEQKTAEELPGLPWNYTNQECKTAGIACGLKPPTGWACWIYNMNAQGQYQAKLRADEKGGKRTQGARRCVNLRVIRARRRFCGCVSSAM